MTYCCAECQITFSRKDKARSVNAFCSRSCSASYNNRKKPKRARLRQDSCCFSCGKGTLNRRFCNLECFHRLRADTKIASWLLGQETRISSYQRDVIRSWLLKDQLEKCALCAQPGNWNGKPLFFVLDHINGDYTDNNRTNLRLICHNCDSQLSTYKGRNRGFGRHVRRQRYADNKSF